ncbi:hypothetical protein DFQ26_006058 [Actinomortierella ambigua]|nr:hypothetical protein DFQ26_006058 [Actinomortierella ambigua]
MLVSVAIGAPLGLSDPHDIELANRPPSDPIYPDGTCGGWALNAQRSSRLPEMKNYTYNITDISGSAAKAAFPHEADNLSADKTYLFIADLGACKPLPAFKQFPAFRYNNAVITKTVYDLSLEVGFDDKYATVFKNLPIARSQYSISGGEKTVLVRQYGNRGTVCVISAGWKCSGHFQLYDGDEVVTGMRFVRTFLPVSVYGHHLFQDFLLDA